MTRTIDTTDQSSLQHDPARARTEWASARRIVVKIGSSLLVDRSSGLLKSPWLETLAEDVAGLVRAGKDVVVVSSGAIALGRHMLSFARGALALEQSQAAAAVGQISLASAYRSVFQARGLTAAQILLTLGDTEERRRYLNARRTIETLLTERAGRRPKYVMVTTTDCRRALPA
jgi:glutamate 5-kinase